MEESPFSKIPSQLDQIPGEVPIVFISYSWDSEQHKQWVLDLSKDLREKYRVYTLLDRYNRGGDDLPTFMQKGLKKADRVLIIGTPTYKKKLENSEGGGAKFEDQVITISLYKDMGSAKFVPVLREGSFSDSFNTLIETRLGYDMRNDGQYEKVLQEIAADLWGVPMNVAPTLGPKPNFTPAAQPLQSIIPETSRDYTTIVKNYLLDQSKQILLTELIETEAKNAFNSILECANYSNHQTPETFSRYIELHKKAIENLMAMVIPIIRYGTIEHHKLLINAAALLCKKPFVNGESTAVGAETVHLLASSFLYHAIGFACVKYARYQTIKNMVLSNVSAPHVLSLNNSISLEFLSGCNHWDNDTLNFYLNASWIHPYSQLVLSAIKPVFSDICFDDNEFTNIYYIWEHFSSLLCRYYKCCSFKLDWNPIGGFIRKRVSLIRNEDDIYTSFFKDADVYKDEWEPLKQGLFNGRYSAYKQTYNESEEYYKQHLVY